MICKEIENRLPAYREDFLSAEEQTTIKAHLASCPDCRRALAGLKKTEQLLHGLGEVEPPPFFEQRIMSRVREEAGRKRGILRRLFYPLHIKVPLQALATILVAVIAIHVYQEGEREMQPIVPLPIPMAERAKGQVVEAPPGPPVSPSIPTPAKRTPAGDLPAEKRQRVPPRHENGGKVDRDAGSQAPMREARPPAPTEADPLMAVRERSVDMQAPMKDESPPAPKEADLPMAVRERKAAPAVAETREGPQDRADKQFAGSALDRPPTEKKQKAQMRDTAPPARESAEMAAVPPPPRRAGRAALEKRPAIDLTLQVTDADAALREIEARIGQVHARITERQLRGGSALLKIETAAPNVAALLDLLGTIGRVNLETRPLVVPEGHVTVSIKIVGHP